MRSWKRIIVIGSTGAGKTTTARRIAASRNLPFVELDALHWDAGWAPAPHDLFRERVAQALAGERWVADGNYSRVRDLVWPRAELLAWLDYELPVLLWRLFKRSMWRVATREQLWNGNRETLRGQFFNRDSLFVWALRSHARHRAEWQAALARPEHAHLQVVRLRTPAAAERWLGSLA